MKHSLKVTAYSLMLIAIFYVLAMFGSTADDMIFATFPTIVVAILTSLSLIEIDRRLSALENSVESNE